MVVTREPMDVEDLRGRQIAIPGEMTTAFLALNLLLGKDSFRHEVVMFDRILEYVASGQADAGLIIHEGQLTYQNHDLFKVVDLGEWWKKETNLPLPLGGNCIRRDHGAAVMEEVAGILKRSIEYSLSNRSAAVEHALQYATLLKQMIRRYLRIAKRSPTSFKSIPDIAKYFQEASREIDELPP